MAAVLKDIFFELTKKYTDNFQLIQGFWNEIDKAYSDSSRHYHNLSHLENLIFQLEEIKNKIEDWDTLPFAILYHDIVYRSTKSNNEEMSAEVAAKRLSEINFPKNKISKCVAMILATKKHVHTGDNDTDLFTDADLSIFGQSWDQYTVYCNQIRKEYSIFPDLIYNPGRKKILNHFLKMDRIFKSTHFYHKMELQAKENLLKELALLKSG